MSLEDIGDNDTLALLCVTDLAACCRSPESSGPIGDWFYPNGTAVPNFSFEINDQPPLMMWELYRNRGPSVVRMIRRRGGESGIYRCVIPDTTGVNQNIYIGVYTASTGEWYMYTTFLFNHSRTAVLALGIVKVAGKLSTRNNCFQFTTTIVQLVFLLE